MAVHLIPIVDDRDHELTPDCACEPDAEFINPETGLPREQTVLTHKPFDGRERHPTEMKSVDEDGDPEPIW